MSDKVKEFIEAVEELAEKYQEEDLSVISVIGGLEVVKSRLLSEAVED